MQTLNPGVFYGTQRIHLRKAEQDSCETSTACVERGLRSGRTPERVSLSGGSVGPERGEE